MGGGWGRTCLGSSETQPPSSPGFHKMEEWQYFPGEKLRRDKGAESESSRLAAGVGKGAPSPPQHEVVASGQTQWCCTLGRGGTARAPCAREGPQLPHWSSNDPDTPLGEPALR